MFEARMNEQADEHAFSGEFSNNNDECGNACGSFKEGYTAALNDLQGKVEKLLNALQKYIDESKHWPISADKYDKGERYSDIAIKAIAEFKNGEVK